MFYLNSVYFRSSSHQWLMIARHIFKMHTYNSTTICFKWAHSIYKSFRFLACQADRFAFSFPFYGSDPTIKFVYTVQAGITCMKTLVLEVIKAFFDQKMVHSCVSFTLVLFHLRFLFFCIFFSWWLLYKKELFVWEGGQGGDVPKADKKILCISEPISLVVASTPLLFIK